jgi:hypothetical protein
MNHEVTQLLSALEQGDPRAASRLLPLICDGLRQLAAFSLDRVGGPRQVSGGTQPLRAP